MVLLLVTESHRASLDRNEVRPYTYTEKGSKSHTATLEWHLTEKEKKINKNKQLTIYMLLIPENSFSRLPLALSDSTPLSFFFNIYLFGMSYLSYDTQDL